MNYQVHIPNKCMLSGSAFVDDELVAGVQHLARGHDRGWLDDEYINSESEYTEEEEGDEAPPRTYNELLSVGQQVQHGEKSHRLIGKSIFNLS